MGAIKERQSLESTLAAVLAHPVRVKVFVALAERPASATQLMHAFGLTDVGHVSYHIKKLKELGMVEEVDSRPVRGSTERFYRAMRRPFVGDEEWAELSQDRREALTRYVLQLHVTDVALAVDSGTFDQRLDRCLLRHPMRVDAEGFAELNALEAEGYERRLEIQTKSAERLAAAERCGEEIEEIAAMATSLLFEMPANVASAEGKDRGETD